MSDPLEHLNELERRCVLLFLGLLTDRLEGNLREIWLFGSFARGDPWGPNSPMNSDIDLLILTDEVVPEAVLESLLNETYPLYLECGRQIAPQFKTASGFQNPAEEVGRAFKERVATEGKRVHPPMDAS